MYCIPSLFQSCCLVVPYLLRPRSTDGVLLIGSQRSGSYPHKDPTYTSAWNWLLHGMKRWVLFPPSVSRATIVGEALAHVDPNINLNKLQRGSLEFYQALATKGAGYWWAEQYPALLKRKEEVGLIEVIQKEGEVIFVPAGWWHAVINITPWTVAITHNVILPDGLKTSFSMAIKDDLLFARRWWRCLKRFGPDNVSSLIGKDVVEEMVLKSERILALHYGTQMDCDIFSSVLAQIDDQLED